MRHLKEAEWESPQADQPVTDSLEVPDLIWISLGDSEEFACMLDDLGHA